MKLSVISRSCGTCTACCTTCAIAELGKPMNTHCVHQLPAGCAIHGHHPASCRAFTCAWLAGDLPEKQRPDYCGIVFWLGDANTIQASLTRPDVPLDRVEYLAEKLRSTRPERRTVLVIPSDLHVASDPAAAAAITFKPLGNDLFLAMAP